MLIVSPVVRLSLVAAGFAKLANAERVGLGDAAQAGLAAGEVFGQLVLNAVARLGIG